MTEDVRKPATSDTIQANEAVAAALPLADQTDFERNARGLVSQPEELVITSDSGTHVVWDMTRFDFLEAEPTDTVNPSLWRQEQLNNATGLFELADRVFQVRGYDISNISFIEGDTGWIVIDPLTSTETARAAFELLTEHKGEKPVHAVIYTHSHADHFAGVLGVTTEEAVASGDVTIIAPEGFLEAAVFENVIAGPAMLRRAAYMYGGQLPTDPQGVVGSGLGRTLPVGGGTALVAPTDEITHTGEERTIDGVRIVFQVTPETEAPAEMNFAFPGLRTLCMAENCTCVMHNVYTLRGAHIRDALAWSKYIHEARQLFAADADLCFASHNWPVWGTDEIDAYLRSQRDTYRYIHDQTMRLANQGLTSTEIAEQLALPDSLADQFNNRGYYGTVSHNAKAVYQKYLGWFDGNPANLNPLPPEDSAPRYVQLMGGAEAILEQAQRSFDAGEYRWVAQVVNHLVFAEPDNAAARRLQADALEQLGYQAESGPWRNFYLTGAQELRHGVRERSSTASGGAPTGLLKAMRVDMIFDLLGVRIDGPAADGQDLGINWVFTDLDQEWSLHLEHGAVHYDEGLDGDADVTLTLSHEILADLLAGGASVETAFGDGGIEVDGDAGVLLTFFGLLDTELNTRFNIVTP